MRRLGNLAVLVLLLALPLGAQTVVIGQGILSPTTVASLPDPANDGVAATVKDGLTLADCVTGGGVFRVHCVFDGNTSTWEAVSAGSGTINSGTDNQVPAYSGAGTTLADADCTFTLDGTNVVLQCPTDSTTGFAFNDKDGNIALGIDTLSNPPRVGIGTAIPATAFHVVRGLEGSVPGSPASSSLIVQSNEFATSDALISLLAGTSGESIVEFADSGDRNIGFISYDHLTNEFKFGTNTAARMTIDSSGNVGIGAAAPGGKLAITGTIGFDLQAGDAGTVGQDNILLLNSTNGGGDGNYGPGVSFGFPQDASVRRYASIASVQTAADPDQIGLAFITHPSATSSGALVEQVRITHDGNVGIGTAAPDGTLHAHTASAGSITPSASGDDLLVESAGNTGISILTPDSNFGSLVWGSPSDIDNVQLSGRHNAGSPFLQILVGGGEHIRIQSDGNVGIGTAAPARILETNSDNGVIRIADANATTADLTTSFIEFGKNGGGWTRFAFLGLGSSTNDNFSIVNESSGGHILVNPTGAGSVGIGPNNTSPPAGSTMSCMDGTVTTGDTNCIFKAGPGQSAKLFVTKDNSDSEGWGFGPDELDLVTGAGFTHNIRATGGGLSGQNISFAPLADFTRTSSGTQTHLGTNSTFNPTSGPVLFIDLELAPTVDQTGGANGITRGLRINPTLTAAADFRAIEVEDVGASQFAIKTGTGAVDFGDKLSAEPGGNIGPCKKYTKTFTDLTDADTEEDEVLFNLPARGKVWAVNIKHSTAFSGGGLSAMTVSVGDSTSPTFYAIAFDVFQAVANDKLQDGPSAPNFLSSTWAARDVFARFTSTGANMDAVTAGSVDVHVCWLVLPL